MSAQDNQKDDTTMELTNPVADPRIVDKLAVWLLEKKPWAYTGHKSTRSNAKPKELWVRFHKDTEVWWFEHFRYSTEPRGRSEWAISRDHWLGSGWR